MANRGYFHSWRNIKLKIAIVDDSKKRSKEIKELLISECYFNKEDIHIYDKTQDAKTAMRNIIFDILILDVILPKRDETASAEAGLALLSDIHRRPTIETPGKIIGITASKDDISKFKDEFENYTLTVIEASNSNKTWKRKIVDSVSYKKNAVLSKDTKESNVLCFTIHGIRTRGKWQQQFQQIVNECTSHIEFASYKYGFFSLLSFYIPFLRIPIIYKFKNALIDLIEQNEDKKIIIFSHSFGTYIVIKAIESIIKKSKITNISTIVLSGCVLKSNYKFNKIRKNTTSRIVNDCGSSDYTLYVSEALVLGTGMAGKVGFNGVNDKRFANRSFKGGHSHYFENNGDFMKRYWIPLISDSHELEVIDNTNDNVFKLGVMDKIISITGKLKGWVYLSVLLYFLYPWLLSFLK